MNERHKANVAEQMRIQEAIFNAIPAGAQTVNVIAALSGLLFSFAKMHQSADGRENFLPGEDTGDDKR